MKPYQSKKTPLSHEDIKYLGKLLSGFFLVFSAIGILAVSPIIFGTVAFLGTLIFLTALD